MRVSNVVFYRTPVPVHGDGLLADLLRYDVAFTQEADPALVAFPSFATPVGRMGGRCTVDRWAASAVILERAGGPALSDVLSYVGAGVWTTYRRPPGRGTLVPVTLRQVLQAKSLADLDLSLRPPDVPRWRKS